MSFSRVEESLEMPDLIEVQKNSYQRFLQEDLREVLADVSPITDYSESLVLEFTDYSLDETPQVYGGKVPRARFDVCRAAEGECAPDQPQHA